MGVEADGDLEGFSKEMLVKAAEEGQDFVAKSNDAETEEPKEAAGESKSKTVADWAAEQEEFENLPPLPDGWIRIKSQSTGRVYYMNTYTGDQTFIQPKRALPDGWEECRSKSTNQTCYYHRQTD